jgi:thymidine kinase
MANAGKTVVVVALDGTFQRKPFNRILELVPLAEKVVKLTAICHKCKKDASFTQRTIMSDRIELIGGSESYVASCRECFKMPENQPSNSSNNLDPQPCTDTSKKRRLEQ